MFDYRLFYCRVHARRQRARSRRPILGHDAKRVYRLRPSAEARRSNGPPLAMVHDVIATCPVCADELTITRLHCRELRNRPGGRVRGRSLRPPGPRADEPARKLPALARQPQGDGARAWHQLPHRPRPGRRPGPLPRSGRGHDGDADDDFAGDFAEALRRCASGTDRCRPGRERRDILERLARKEIERREAAAALRELGVRLMATFVRTQEIEHEIGPTGHFALRVTSPDVEMRAVDGGIARVRVRSRSGPRDAEADEMFERVQLHVTPGAGSWMSASRAQNSGGLGSLVRLFGGSGKVDGSVAADVPAGRATAIRRRQRRRHRHRIRGRSAVPHRVGRSRARGRRRRRCA